MKRRYSIRKYSPIWIIISVVKWSVVAVILFLAMLGIEILLIDSYANQVGLPTLSGELMLKI